MSHILYYTCQLGIIFAEIVCLHQHMVICNFLFRAKDYKTFSMLNSAEHEIHPDNKYQNANSGHSNMYYLDKFHAQLC